MIDPKEFVRGEHLPYTCDMIAGTEERLPYLERLEVPDKKYVSIYAKTENVCAAHDIIRNNPDKLFTLVTHNSDMSIDPCTMPDNIHRWFAMNRNTTQGKIHSIPIGLENEHWFPYKQGVMLDTYRDALHLGQRPRTIKAFAQFNSGTHSERIYALNNLDASVYDLYTGHNGDRDQHELFCRNLLNYAFCLCPRGNGIDTHRLWESLYMGCIPICKNYPAHRFDEPLPILFVEDWDEITIELLEHTYKNIDRSLFDSNLLKMSYWSKRINNEL